MGKIDIDPLKAICNRDTADDEQHALLDCATLQDAIIYMTHKEKQNIGQIRNFLGTEFVVRKINGFL